MDQLLAKINKLAAWQAALIIVGVGIIVFFTGLNNPFQGDDTYQIVNNPPVHSMSNLVLFFESSTFYNGQALSGNYYRPMMTTVFALIYSIVGPHTFLFHVIQLSFYVAGAFVLYLVFTRFLKPAVALPLALIFLVHPLNSQVVYSIPTMQDALYFCFGILALWLLMRSTSTGSLWAVAGLLLLAMLSKESGVLFTAIAALYLFLFDRERLRAFLLTMVLPVVMYLALKVHAVGLNRLQRAAPIDNTSLLGRLYTDPSIIFFYLSKFVFPGKLATAYYWVYPSFSVRHVLVPLAIDLAAAGLFVYLGVRIRRKLSKTQFHAYLFFAAWTVMGLSLYMQVIRLDMTACETWFYFVMAGLLGMIGVALSTVKVRLQPEWLILPVVLLVVALGIRTALRGTDYRSQYNLAVHDLAVAGGDNYAALSNISQYLIDHRQYKEAAVYARRSIKLYPVVSNYNNLGVALEQSGDYLGAAQAYSHALKYNDLGVIYENLGLILIVYSDPASTSRFFQKAINAYPHDFRLWVYLAIFEGAKGDKVGAKTAIKSAAQYDSVPPYIYNNIMNDRPFTLPLLGKTLLIQ